VVETAELAPNEKRCSKCKEVKDRGEFGKDKSRNDGKTNQCRKCCSQKLRQPWAAIKKERLIYGYKCENCGEKFLHLNRHMKFAHSVDTTNPMMSELTRGRLKNKALLQEKPMEITWQRGYRLAFPKEYWPSHCNYVRFKLNKKFNQILLNPYTKKITSSRKLQSNRARYYISLTNSLAEQIQLDEAKIFLDKSFIVIQLQNSTLLDEFEFWINGNKRNYSGVYTDTKRVISIAKVYWPLNVNFVLPEFYFIRNTAYLDLIPVSDSGEITFKNGKLGQYVGRENCYTLFDNGARYQVNAKGFFMKNNIPSGDWDLKEVLPSGALRFRLYKEREAKQEQEAS
jgi:hypothetical protein